MTERADELHGDSSQYSEEQAAHQRRDTFPVTRGSDLPEEFKACHQEHRRYKILFGGAWLWRAPDDEQAAEGRISRVRGALMDIIGESR